YLDALPLPDEARAELSGLLAGSAGAGIPEINAWLCDRYGAPDAQAAMLEASYGAELAESGLVRSTETGTCVTAAPDLNRTSMVPEPWTTNPLVRAWNGSRGKAQ